MATSAQVLANQANAQLSTGPKTAEGKARSSRNNLQHGLTLGLLAIAPEDQSAFCEFEANFKAELKPEGSMELEAFQQFLDAAWRLRAIRAIVQKICDESEDDAFIRPETEPQLRQLSRYRASAEMLAYRAVKTLRDLQTTRLYRTFHVTPEEQTVIPPLVRPALKMLVDGERYAHNDREIFYHIYGPEAFTKRFEKPPLTA